MQDKPVALQAPLLVLLTKCLQFDAPLVVPNEIVQEPSSWNWYDGAASFAAAVTAYDERIIRSLEVENVFCGYASFEESQFSLRFPAWVATQIVLFPNRAKCLYFFIQVARVLLETQSFNAFSLLMTGLGILTFTLLAK